MNDNIKERKIRRIMMGLIIIGVSLVLTGIYLIVFTDMVTTKGADGILIIAGVIASGLFISVPAKIYLTLQLMKYNDETLRAQNRGDKS